MSNSEREKKLLKKQLKAVRKALKAAVLALCDLTWAIDDAIKEMEEGDEPR